MNGWFFFFLGFAMVFILIANVFLYGVRRTGKYASLHTERGLKNHCLWVNRYLWTTFFSVVMIELMVKSYRGIDEGVTKLFDTNLGMIHAGFNLVYAISLISMKFFFTGLKIPKVHKSLFKVVCISYLGIIITGIILAVHFLI